MAETPIPAGGLNAKGRVEGAETPAAAAPAGVPAQPPAGGVGRSFLEWKAEAVLRLMVLKALHYDDPRVREAADILITKLRRLKVRDLAVFLALAHQAAAATEEFLSILPTEEEVRMWFSSQARKGEKR